jgi:RNA polymerase sigma factor (sigma-70 family)
MSHENELQQMPLGDLAQRCAQETDSYFRKKSNDPRYCLELFRRAIVVRDDGAWSAIYTQYQPEVEKWVYKHSEIDFLNEEAQDFVVQAFGRFSAYFTAEKFANSRSLAAILSYLQMCVHAAITDAWRKGHRIQLEQDARDDEEQEHSEPAVTPEDHFQNEEFWQLIKRKSKDPREYLVIYCSFYLGLSPREILAECPNEFRSIKEIYQHKANFLERLGRDAEFKEFGRQQ